MPDGRLPGLFPMRRKLRCGKWAPSRDKYVLAQTLTIPIQISRCCSTSRQSTLLLDTHTLLWSLNDPNRLPKPCREAIEPPNNQIWVSSISVWEICIKAKTGRLRSPDDLAWAISSQGMEHLPFTVAHAIAIVELPFYHRDPFDRALIAQASNERLRLVTADKALIGYAKHIEILFVD